MPKGTVAKNDNTNWWSIVDDAGNGLVTFDHDKFPFENGSLVNYTDPDGDLKADTVTSAFDGAAPGRVAESARFSARLSGSLAGALRVTPPRASPAPMVRDLAPPPEKPKATTPAYVTAVALLFPVEAATLFPVGQSIAGNDWRLLAIVILATVLFVVVLRYFATQDVDGDGEPGGQPAWNEIGSAVTSLLLWIGATKGYWVASKDGLPNFGITPEKGAAIFGFITIMWVALAPYIVREMAKRDAAKAKPEA
nr:hypothetical protein [uncultured Sphingomonas sp.]